MPRTPDGYARHFMLDLDLSGMVDYHRKNAILATLRSVQRDIEDQLGWQGTDLLQEHAITEYSKPIGCWKIVDVLDVDLPVTPPEPNPDVIEIGDKVSDGKGEWRVIALYEDKVQSMSGSRVLQTIAWLRGSSFGGMKLANVDLLTIVEKWTR